MIAINLQETPIFVLHIFGSEVVKNSEPKIQFVVEQLPTIALDGKFHLTLDLFVPELNGYKFRLLSIEHPPALYPLSLVENVDGKTHQITNVNGLRTRFKLLLHSQTMQAIVAGLMAQMLAVRQLKNVTQ